MLRILQQLRTWGVRGAWSAAKRLPHERMIAWKLKRNAKRHVGTMPVRGITVVAPMSGAYSLSKTMRDFVVRLKEVGVPCQVFDTYQKEGRAAEAEWKPLLTPEKEFNLLKYDHVVEMLTSPLPRGLPLKRCRIAFWEAEAGILETFPYLTDSYAVIGMSDYNAEYFRREMGGTVKVAKILYPLMLPTHVMPKDEARQHFGIPADDFVVFYNFDISADYRKNSRGTLQAFTRAFKDTPRTRLVLKINHARGNPEKMAALKALAHELGIADKLQIITTYLSEAELYGLTNTCDVYLSLHRAEGFGLGMAEAMSMGKPVVATNYSASTEFCKEGAALLVPYKMVPVEEGGFAGAMKRWAEPDVDAAAMHLKRLYSDISFRQQIGEAGRTSLRAQFSLANFTQSVVSFLSE